MAKVVSFIIFVLIAFSNVDAYNVLQKGAIKLALDPPSLSCKNATNVTAEQVMAAETERDVNKISPCFFKCFLKNTSLIKEESGKEVLDVPATLIFAKLVIPTITLFNVIPVTTEVTKCASEFSKDTQSDDDPNCLKTKVLVNCLAKQETLINAIIQAVRSPII